MADPRVAEDPRPGPSPEHDGEALRLAAHPAFDQLAGLGEDAELAFLLVDVHANMVHGWPRVENATAVIWKTLLIAEQTFRRLDAPELLAEVAEGVVYVNGVRVQRTEDTAKKKAAA